MNSADSKTVQDMDKRALTALQGSIAKWGAIVNDGGIDMMASNCPLCTEFLSGNCVQCPVYWASSQPGCSGTPYMDWARYFMDVLDRRPRKVVDEESKRLAQAELDFLKSLLPLAATPRLEAPQQKA